jgi:hypothetical protein|tara:strand:+ start:85 stop:1077 length:993 start_codon:yes stop_codon:yes gene_type:complete
MSNAMETKDLVAEQNILAVCALARRKSEPDVFGIIGQKERAYQNLCLFAEAVQKVFPLCSFASVNPSGRREGGARGVDRRGSPAFHVYHKHKPFVMGFIGYELPDTGDNGRYIVNCRSIVNNRYSTYSAGYHEKKSKNLDTAVKAVKARLRDLSPTEIAAVYEYKVTERWRSSATSPRDAARKLRRNLADFTQYGDGGPNKDDLLEELRALDGQGYQFINAEFGAQVKTCLAAYELSAEKLRERGDCVTMVSVEPSSATGDNLFVTARTENISGADNKGAREWSPKGTFVEGTLDPDIMGKLAVLNMCDVGHWVDNVGYKATETIFYVTD